MLFVLANASALLAALAAAGVAMSGREPWRRALAALAGFPVVVVLVSLLLGALGRLSAPWAVAATAILAIPLSALWLARHHQSAICNLKSEIQNGDRALSALALALFAAVCLQLLLRSGLAGVSYCWDDLSYCGPAAAHWVVGQRLSLAPFWYQAYYPLNAELFSAWFMLPFRSDALVGLSGLSWAALAVAACAALARAQGVRGAAVLMPGALLLASPIVLGSASRFSADDLAGPAAALAALAFAARGTSTAEGTLADAAYAGLLAGLAAGCKALMALVPVLLFLWLVFDKRWGEKAGARVKAAAVFVLCAAATGGFWYARNLALTGNPFFPAQVGPFAGPMAGEPLRRTKLISWIIASPGDTRQWLAIFGFLARWPVCLFAVSAGGLAVGAWAWLSRRGRAASEAGSVQRLVVAMALALILLYPFAPFSATDDSPRAKFGPEARFLIAPFAMGVVLFSSLLASSRGLRWLWAGLAAAAVAGSGGVSGGLATMGVVAVAVLLHEKVDRPALAARRWRWALLTAVPVCLAAIALIAPRIQRMNDSRIYAYGGAQRPVGAAWRAADALPSGSRVAWFGPAAYQYYPLMGRRLQLSPCAVTEEGHPLEPLHVTWLRNPRGFQWWAEPGKPDLSRVVENLAAAGVDYVLVTKWDEDAWPPQRAALSASGRASMVYEDGYSELWRLGQGAGR